MKWSNWIGQLETEAQVLQVRSRLELEATLRALPNLKEQRLKVMSSGHSTSDVARPVPDHHLVVLDRETWQSDPQQAGWYRTPLPPGVTPYWVPASRTIKELNQELAAKHLALENLGSYDQQTIYGAICTGTHGSGMVSGPLADFVLALDLTCVVDNGTGEPRVKSYRLEPASGLTDPARFKCSGVTLVQDDAVFRAAVVSMGLFGVVTGLVLKVVPEFWLEETRDALSWSALKAEVAAGTFDPSKERRCDLVLTSLPVGRPAQRWVLRTRRKDVPAQAGPGEARHDKRTQTARAQWTVFNKDRREAARLLSEVASDFPQLANNFAWNQLEADTLAPPPQFVSRSEKVLFSSVGDYVAAISAEPSVPLARWVEAADAIAAELDLLHRDHYHLLSPVGIRFVRGSSQLLAPQAGRDTCTFELPTLYGAHRWGHSPDMPASWLDIAEMLTRLEKVLVERFDGRPHWGQSSWADPAVVQARYGDGWQQWKTQRARFDPYGVFSNAFSHRYGL